MADLKTIAAIVLSSGKKFKSEFDIINIQNLAGAFSLIFRTDGLSNVVCPDGKLFTDEWFTKVYFNGKFFRVQDIQKQYFLLDMVGEVVLPDRYYWVSYPSQCPGTKSVRVIEEDFSKSRQEESCIALPYC
jgi:hypothetical protein